MVFASLTFLYGFLPVVLLAYYLVPRGDARNVVLILASLFFYAWGEPIWVSLLLISAFADYVHGRVIEAHRGSWQAKAALVSSLVVNLGLLGSFKYAAFITGTINGLLGTGLPEPSFGLPIGISFYTFQTLSYAIDVYRGEVPAQRSALRFLLFVSLFHQLVAGPIVRYKDIAQQINHREFSLPQFSSGITRFVVGLAKKVMIANVAGELALPFLEGAGGTSVLGAWYGIFLFGLQIYFDFSGYSDMAIGLGRMFGFEYMENFRYPYAARSASEFWRRWHISLGTWFRDYVYIPLGGNRRAGLRNLMVVWFLTGLWHGASWNFVLWGLFYGVLIGIERGLRTLLPRVSEARWLRPFGHLYLVVITLFGWSLFYFTDFALMAAHIGRMLGIGASAWSSLRVELSVAQNLWFLLIAVVASLPVVPALSGRLSAVKAKVREFVGSLGQPALTAGMLLVSTVLLVGATYNPFLYFRF